MSDLESATTEELLDELHARFPSLIVAGIRLNVTETKNDRVLYVEGDPTVCLGLLARLSGYVGEVVDESDLAEGDE